jgi:hypothetical protein
LTFLDDYLAIESARFEERITVSVHANDDLMGCGGAKAFCCSRSWRMRSGMGLPREYPGLGAV